VLPNGAGKGDLFFDAGVEGATTLNATLNMQGFNETINGLGHTSGNAFIQNQAAATTSTLTVGDNNATATFNGILRNNSGAGGTLAFTKMGTGTQTIGGTSANTYTGLTSVNGGTLVLNKTGGITAIGGNLTIGDGTGTDTVRLNNVNQIVDTSNIILNAGGVLNLNGNVETVATVNGAATSAIQNTSASPTTLTLTSGTMAGTISNSGGGALGITKNGAGTLALSNAGNSYTGKTVINGGTLEINTGNEATLGANPAAFASDHFTLSSGTLRIMGSSITIDDSNRGISLGAGSSSTIDVDSGLVANVLNMISGGSADLNKNGTGTLNLTSDNQLSKLFVNNGTLTQSGGSIKLNSASGGTVLAGATYNLSGGTLRTDSLNNAGTLNWNAILTGKQTQAGTANGTDWTLNPAASSGPVVQTGTKILGSGTLNTGAGAVLNLDGLYLSTSVLVDRFEMAGTLDLSLAGDTLDWNDSTVYLLRPFGFFTEDYGSIPLVAASSITGTFNTFNGLTADSRGFTTLASIIGGLPIDPSTLGTNEGLLQYADNVVNPAGFAPGTYDIIYFHYKVAGFVPEPDTFAFLALGVIGLRTARRMKALRDRLS
jgi:autotransporter-associated beta strand protein